MLTQSSPAVDVCVARQPIFDRKSGVYGYELLYRSSARATSAGVADASHMSSCTLVQAVLGIGLDSLTGDKLAFVNFPRELLLSHDFQVLHPERCVIELLETVSCDAQTLAACELLRARGFTLALDDFVAGEEYAPILRLAQIVKIDVLGRTKDDIAAQVALLEPYRVSLLAEKIDSAEGNTMCRELGFDYFQGYYFQKPETVQRRDLPAGMIAVLRLMNLVGNARTHDRQLEAVFNADPGLSYKLLQIANSAGFGLTGIATIGQAIRLVGRGPLRRWLSLLLLSFAPRKDGVSTELVLTSLQRAWLCEKMAAASGHTGDAPSLFLAGLLSNFDAILGLSREALLHRVNVSAEVESALLYDAGPFSPYVSAASALVDGDFDTAEEMTSPMGMVRDMPGWLSDASHWAREAIQGIEPVA